MQSDGMSLAVFAQTTVMLPLVHAFHVMQVAVSDTFILPVAIASICWNVQTMKLWMMTLILFSVKNIVRSMNRDSIDGPNGPWRASVCITSMIKPSFNCCGCTAKVNWTS
jgi:hypothetical protein